jgi:hypothetical protein
VGETAQVLKVSAKTFMSEWQLAKVSIKRKFRLTLGGRDLYMSSRPYNCTETQVVLDRQSVVPLYYQIQQRLTEQIRSGEIVGRNVELVHKERIVQAWRPADWEAGVYTLVRFELKEWGQQTKIVLDHTGFPEGNFRHLNPGWYEHYWEPLRKFVA